MNVESLQKIGNEPCLLVNKYLGVVDRYFTAIFKTWNGESRNGIGNRGMEREKPEL